MIDPSADDANRPVLYFLTFLFSVIVLIASVQIVRLQRAHSAFTIQKFVHALVVVFAISEFLVYLFIQPIFYFNKHIHLT